MTALEDRLRESLHERAGHPKLPADVAGSAIRGARQHQRRRLVTAAAAGAVVVLAAIGAVALGRPAAGPPPDPADSNHSITPTPTVTATGTSAFSVYGVHLDVLSGRSLTTVDGPTWTFAEPPTYVARVPAGWLYTRSDRTSALLRTDGTSINLPGPAMGEPVGFEQPGHPVVSSDGQYIAWVIGTKVFAARLTANGLADQWVSPVPVDTFAQTWIGKRVVLGQSYGTGCCGYHPARFDVWDPQQGAFLPQWTEGLNPVYGPVPDGVPAFAMVEQTTDTGTGCLAQVDGVAGMAPATARACVPGLGWGSLMGLLAPDGRHLVELGPGDMLQSLDLASAFQSPGSGRPCPGGIPLAWEDNSTYLAVTNGSPGERFYRCRVGSDQVDTLTGLTLSDRPVSRYGV